MQTFAMELLTRSPHQHRNRKVDKSGCKYLNRDFSELFNHFTWLAFTVFLSSLCHLIEESAARGIPASLLERDKSQKGCTPPHTGISESNQGWIAQAHRPCQAHMATNSKDWSLLVAIFRQRKSQTSPGIALETDRWRFARQQSPLQYHVIKCVCPWQADTAAVQELHSSLPDQGWDCSCSQRPRCNISWDLLLLTCFLVRFIYS